MRKLSWIALFLTITLATVLLFSLALYQTGSESPSAWFSLLPYTVSAHSGTAYVAETGNCDGHTHCYTNTDGVDEADGVGTGLRAAITAPESYDKIIILGNYPIKTHAVLIDRAVTISGLGDASLTYAGSNCDNPMLSITAGATIRDLNINDGNCAGASSRTLLQINKNLDDVHIEHNTLTEGLIGVEVLDNTGNVTVAFNDITNHETAVVSRVSDSSAGTVQIYANNIVGNGTTTQVTCNNKGSADHNYWGEDRSATDSASACSVSNGKQLGASILLSSQAPGVEAYRETVSGTKTYVLNNKIALNHTTGSDYDVIIVNHGQGSDNNIPFLNEVGNTLIPCSNFYDIFLENNEATASDLVLALKYDLNSACIHRVESSDYCESDNPTQFPLWWYDPANGITNGWDTTGEHGPITTCNAAANEIQVTINNTGRPNLSNDLHFTPFVAGVTDMGNVTLAQFQVAFDVTENDIQWTTTSEQFVDGFHILRSDTQNGTYSRISPLIEAIGEPDIGGIYTYEDTNIVFTRTYYYKLEVISGAGDSLATYGPVSVLTATATPTVTPTRTPTVTRTLYPSPTPTPYYYRSPTSYYRPATATPRGGSPTQVRTYGPTPSPTSSTKPAYNPTTDGTAVADNGYPLETPIGDTTQGYPGPEDDGRRTSTPGASGEGGDSESKPPEGEPTGPDENKPDASSGQPIQWYFMLIGALSGFILLGGVGVVLVKTRLP